MALPATGTATRDGSCCCGGECGGCACSPLPTGIDLDLSGLTLNYGSGSSCTFDGVVLSLTRSEAQACTWSADYAETGCALGSPCSDTPLSVNAAFTFECPGTTTLSMSLVEATTGCNFFVQWTQAFLDAGDREAAGIDCGPFAATLTGLTVTNFSLPGACLCAGTVSVSGSVTLAEASGPLAVAAVKTAAAPEPPCRWRGAELTGPERAALALDHRKTWFRCGKPDFPRLGLPVTDCRTCKVADMRCSRAGCTGYEPADVDGRPDV